MSRRKQSKPQCVHMDSHLTLSQQSSSDYHARNIDSLPCDVHVCESCSAEYFSLSDLQEHQMGCFKNPLVLLVSENPASPSSTFTSPTHNVEEQTNDNGSTEGAEGLLHFSKEENNSSVCNGNGPSQSAYENNTSVPVQADSPTELSKVLSINSNVFIENLESTKVAVAQFSQEVCLNAEVNSSSPTNCSMAVPELIEQLMALQQQQLRQLKLIEQIRHQILLLAAQNTDTSAHSSTCQGTSEISLTDRLVTLSSSLSQQLAEAAGLAQSLARQSTSKAKQIKHTVLSSNQDSTAVLSVRDISQIADTNRSNLISRLGTYPPKKQSSHDSTVCSQPSVTSPSPSHAFTTDNAPNLASNFSLPQSATENYVFANTLPSIGEIVEDLNALTALAQQRRGRLSKVTSSEHKRPFDEGLFKHKCRFCAKVFGSDSALKIHIRSHTGERPYKCNICGNRFSTRGNLKVHFQRHKEKYPNIQMNPYPVPEHLDNVPTSTGIPYGMSLVPDKPTSKWLDSKPSVTILPGLLTSSMPSLPSIIKRETKVVPIVRPSILDGIKGFETSERGKGIKQEISSIHFPMAHEKYEDIKQYFNFTTSLDSSGNGSEERTSADTSMDESIHKNLVTPILCENFKPKCPLGSLPDLIEASETAKLQQLVENIDRKCIDPNECMVCHRVLSCQSALKMHYRTHTGERPFRCKICGRSFTTKGNLKTHFNIHRVMSPLKVQHSCPLCQEKFTNAMVLQRHIRIHMIGHIPNDALRERHQKSMEHDTCSVIGKNCDDNFPDDNMEITESVSDSNDAESSLDSLCSSPTSIPSIKTPDLKNQVPIAQENKLLIDSLENESVEGDYFTIQSFTADDQITQTARSPTLSETSQDSLPQKSSALDNYICLTSETSHRALSVELTGTSLLQPNLTSSLDPNAADIPNHGMTMNCPSYEPETHKINACGVCNKTFTCQSALDIHYRSHTKERPFICMACKRGFSTKGNLKQHMLTHQLKDLPTRLFEPANKNLLSLSNPSPPTMGYLIPSKIKMEFNSTLNKDGNESSRLMTSLAPSLPVISGPPATTRRTSKQHFCHTCGKTFSSSSALQIHERTHTGEKPFGCTICGRAFTTKGNLKVHMGTHMWNGSRRGRKLSIEGPLKFPKSNPIKDPETLSKNTVCSGQSVAVWNQYITAPLTTGLALKSNEISVIQNGSIPHLSLPVGYGGNSPIGGLTASLEKPHHVEISRVIPWPERLGENGTGFNITPLTGESKTD